MGVLTREKRAGGGAGRAVKLNEVRAFVGHEGLGGSPVPCAGAVCMNGKISSPSSILSPPGLGMLTTSQCTQLRYTAFCQAKRGQGSTVNKRIASQ